MLAIRLSIFIFVSITLEQLHRVFGQQLPPVPCPQYFQYQHDGFGYFGKITLPQLPVGMSEVRIETSQQGLLTSKYRGQIVPYPNETELFRNVLQHKGATFRVNFPDPSTPPKLTALLLDNVTLCEGATYPSPHTWSQLTYNLSTFSYMFQTYRNFTFQENYTIQEPASPPTIPTIV